MQWDTSSHLYTFISGHECRLPQPFLISGRQPEVRCFPFSLVCSLPPLYFFPPLAMIRLKIWETLLILACEMFISGYRPRLKNIACVNSLLSVFPHQVPIVIPILVVLASIYLVIAPFYEEPLGSLFFLLFILAGVPFYLVFVQFSHIVPTCFFVGIGMWKPLLSSLYRIHQILVYRFVVEWFF